MIRAAGNGPGMRPACLLATYALPVWTLLAPVCSSALPAGPSATPAATDRADTARLGFTLADSLPAPHALHVLADTVPFGGILPVAWDLPAEASDGVADLPAPTGDQLAPEPAPRRAWWRIVGGDRSGEGVPPGALTGLPPASGPRVVARYRVYRTDPFRLEWAGHASQVITVRGRVEDPEQVAAIRDPRSWPWYTPQLLGLLAGLVLLAALFWWWWRRRRQSIGPEDWPLPEPAWLEAALALEGLLRERRLERGEARAFLDGLALVARRFAAARYGVPAGELTGSELVEACSARGYDIQRPTALARLIDAADLRRYDPESLAPDWCREQAAELVARLAADRIMPRQTPVGADRLLAAQKAWAEVTAAIGTLSPVATATSPGRGTR